MSVIPFDPERPFPWRARDRRAGDGQERIERLEQSLALLLDDCARHRERADDAESRLEALTAELFRSDLAEERSLPLTKAG